MKPYLLFISLLSVTFLFSQGQQESKGTYKIYPNSKKLPVMILKKKDTVKKKYITDKKITYEFVEKYQDNKDTLRLKFSHIIDKDKKPYFLEFKKIDANIEYSKGYLLVKPYKFCIDEKCCKKKCCKKKDCKKKCCKKKDDKRTKEIKNFLNNNKNIFGIKLSPNKLALIPYRTWQWGAMTVPIKIFLGNESDSIPNGVNNIETDVNINVFFGRKSGTHGFNSKGEVKRKRFNSINFLLGLSKLTLKEGNTDSLVTNNSDILAINTGFAYGFEINKFSIAGILGIDIPTNKLGNKWIFKGHPWLGIGFGYSIFK